MSGVELRVTDVGDYAAGAVTLEAPPLWMFSGGALYNQHLLLDPDLTGDRTSTTDTTSITTNSFYTVNVAPLFADPPGGMNSDLSKVELNVFCNYDSSTFSPPLSSIEGFTFAVEVDTAYVNVNGYTQSTSPTWTHAPATIAPSAKGGTWKVITVMIMASDGPAVDRIGVVRLFGLTLKLQSGLSAGNYKPFEVSCSEYRNSGGTRFNKYEKSLGFGHLDAPALDAEIRVVEKQTVGAFAHSAESTGGGPV